MKNALFQFISGALLLSSLALADSTKSFILCGTLLGGTSKNPVPTKSLVLTVPATATVKFTYTPIITVTPSAATSTSTTTTTFSETTTAIQQTDTLTTTITNTQTTIATQTSIITSTSEITTTVTPTTTVPTSPGFIPASQQTGAALKFRNIRARAPVPGPKQIISRGANKQLTYSPKVYPTSVVCGGVVKIIKTSTKTLTATNTATVTAIKATITETTTASTTTTSTVIPAAASSTTTVFESTTVSATTITTQTTTVTQTLTEEAPAATYYAACGPDNQITSVRGMAINGAVFYNSAQQVTTSNEYDCCVACLTNSACGASAYFGFGFCLLANAPTCNNKQTALGVYTSPFGGGVFVSASNCGGINIA